jgi:hypothetical protein
MGCLDQLIVEGPQIAVLHGGKRDRPRSRNLATATSGSNALDAMAARWAMACRSSTASS